MNTFLRRTKPDRRKKNAFPWLSSDIHKLMRERDSALKAALKSKLVTDRLKFVGIRNKVTKEIRKAKANFFLNVIDQAKGNSKLI